VERHPIQIYIELPGLALSRWGGVLGNVIQQTIERALIQRDLLQVPIVTTGIGFEDFFWLSIAVKDELKALPVIIAELQRMALLSFAQIGQFDGDETIFLTHYSNRTVRPFQECFETRLRPYYQSDHGSQRRRAVGRGFDTAARASGP